MRTALVPNPNAADGNPTSAATALSALSAKLVFVNGTTGNDSLGLRERPDLPYRTLTAAQTAALPGDTIVVQPGSYFEQTLGKTNVSWYLEEGAVLGDPNTDATDPLFVFASGTNHTILGRGTLNFTDNESVGPGIDIGNGCTITIQCKAINTITYNGIPLFNIGTASTLDVTADLIIGIGDGVLASNDWTFRKGRIELNSGYSCIVAGDCYMEDIVLKGPLTNGGGTLRILGGVLTDFNQFGAAITVIGNLTINGSIP